jgi:hypothetical protein
MASPARVEDFYALDGDKRVKVGTSPTGIREKVNHTKFEGIAA